ncbi:MAG: phosphotransferase [Anaerolineae bacterium]|nr:phosphotransferase [Anaerolineae bacterium]
MMNLNVMRQLVAEAEIGAKDMPTAHAALAHWDYDVGTLQHLRYSANAIYTFEQQGVPRILRLVHAGDGINGRTYEHIQAELEFIKYLARQDIPAMRALPSESGTYIETVNSPYAGFYASVFEKAPGNPYLEVDTLDDVQIAAWGQIVAKVHKASEVYQPPEDCRRPAWQDIIKMVATWLPSHEHDGRRFLGQAATWLAGLPTGPEDYGLIHWDFCIDNLAWYSGNGTAGHYHIFDFDDAAYFWYVADLAFGLDDVFDLSPARRDHIMETFLSGYRTVRPAITSWLNEIPRFVKFMYIFKMARDMNALVPADPALDPPWMAAMRVKFENRFAEMREIFIQPF